jgi:SAM-dependent methyltransferase
MASSSSYDGDRLTAELYDHVVPYRERPDVPFYVEEARRSGGPVLELGCGTGRILLPIARAGIEITGLDNSERMLDVCRKRLGDEEPEVQSRVTLRRGDMRRFELGRSFALVTMPFRSFQHMLTVDEELSCLSCIREHVAGGGRLVFDVFNPSLNALTSPDLGQEVSEEPDFALPDGSRVTRTSRVTSRNYFDQQIAVELIYYVGHQDGREERIVHGFPMRYVFRFELEHLLARAGFELVQLYGDFTREPYGAEYPGELVVVAGLNATRAG